MIAIAKQMFFPFFFKAAKEEVANKPAAKDERTALIDKMVASGGIDYNVRRRYFEVSQTV